MPHPKNGKNQRIGFTDAELYTECFQKKKSLKEIKYSRIRQTLKIIDAAISSPIISFWFLSIFGHFQITQENQNHLIQSRKISCNWGKLFFLDYLKRKDS